MRGDVREVVRLERENVSEWVLDIGSEGVRDNWDQGMYYECCQCTAIYLALLVCPFVSSSLPLHLSRQICLLGRQFLLQFRNHTG